ncbi:MAG TPA: hypothetical protein VI461_03325, partial [Chitinophagaceae bacterium]|nr:hypothetical protein [Chitinophagaceae bacterium]
MKKIARSFLLFIFAIIILFCGYAVISGKTYLFKAVYYNFAGIDDYKVFSNDTVAAAVVQPWPVATGFNRIVSPGKLNDLLKGLNTVAVVVIKN